MAEDYQTGTSSGGSWWNPEGSNSFDAPTSVSICSTATADHIGGRGFSWSTATELIEAKARSCDESAASTCGSSITTSQETDHKVQYADHARPFLMDSSTMSNFSLSSSNMNWSTQALLNGGRPENSFHAMLQDLPIESNQVHSGTESSAANPFSNMNEENFSLEQHHFSSIIPASHGCSSMMLQDLLDSETKPQLSIYDNRVILNPYQSPVTAQQGSPSHLWQPSWAKISQLLKSSPSKQQSNNQLQFTNNTPFWNASAAATLVSDARSLLGSPSPSQFVMQQNTICSNLTAKMKPEGVHDSCSSSTKKPGREPVIKKPRTETPSPLPTFKVRKEKLGDRITALQQLVSPFGKTDTASVLQEAIEYIKFLHDQVGVLSSPYLKNGHPMQQKQISECKSKDYDEAKQDLRSRGLCLVPITGTYPVASQTTADFWHPTFGGTFR